MLFFETYIYRIVKYDFINVFFCHDLIQIPSLKKIILNFGYQKSNVKYLISSILALEFISSKKGKITKSKNINLFLKIKKGNPVGCKVVLKKSTMYFFYIKLRTLFLPKVKHFWTSQFQQDSKLVKSISFQLKNPLIFVELENQFQLFKEIPQLDITILTTSKSRKEFFFFLKSIKFFL